MADFASRGIPLDSAIASHMLSQRMAETEGARMSSAQDRGIQLRGSQMAGFGAAAPRFGPTMPADMSPIFRYFGSRPRPTPQTTAPGAAAPNAAAVFGDPSIYGGEDLLPASLASYIQNVTPGTGYIPGYEDRHRSTSWPPDTAAPRRRPSGAFFYPSEMGTYPDFYPDVPDEGPY